MIKCRAKMIDGSPVTFEWHDLGGLLYRDTKTGLEGICGPYTVDMIGEGFFVRIEGGIFTEARFGNIWLEHCRLALEHAGVDTATAQQWDEDIWNQISSYWEGTTQRCRGTLGAWVPLFPPVVHEKPSTQAPGPIWHSQFETVPAEPSPEMLHNGSAALRDAIVLQAMMHKGQFQFRDPLEVVRDIWKRMEKGRRQ